MRRASLWVYVFTGVILAGCNGDASAPQTRPAAAGRGAQRSFIAFVGAGESDPHWPILRHSAQQYVSTLGSMEVRYFTPSGSSAQEQIELLRRLTSGDAAAVCVQVQDPGAIRGILEDAQSRGVVAVAMVHDPGGSLPAGFAGLDEEAVGRTLADAAARTLGG